MLNGMIPKFILYMGNQVVENPIWHKRLLHNFKQSKVKILLFIYKGILCVKIENIMHLTTASFSPTPSSS